MSPDGSAAGAGAADGPAAAAGGGARAPLPRAKGKLVTNVNAEVAQDMLRFAEQRRTELQPTDFAAMSRWRSFAAVQIFSWGVATSAVAYIGARLAAPRGPLPRASKAITVAAFVIGGATALPATAPQLIHDAQALPTPFGAFVRESVQRHSANAGLGAGWRQAGGGEQQEARDVTDVADAASTPRPTGAVNQWGDPIDPDPVSAGADGVGGEPERWRP